MARKGSISSLFSTQPGSFLEFADSTPNLNPTSTPNSNFNPASNSNISLKEKTEYKRLRKTFSQTLAIKKMTSSVNGIIPLHHLFEKSSKLRPDTYFFLPIFYRLNGEDESEKIYKFRSQRLKSFYVTDYTIYTMEESCGKNKLFSTVVVVYINTIETNFNFYQDFKQYGYPNNMETKRSGRTSPLSLLVI